MQAVLFENAHLIDPSQNIDRKARLLIQEGAVVAIDPSDDDIPNKCLRRSLEGHILAPGFIDLGTELGEPGREEDETIETGLAAALAGGFTSVVCSANTFPPIDTAASVQFVQQRAARCNLARAYVLGCVSKARKGEELAEIGSLFEAGAVGFSDAPAPIENTALLKRALEYCVMFNLPILEPPEVVSLSAIGVMHEDLTQLRLGLAPMPAEAEDLATSRNLRLVEATGGKLHLSSISTSGSVEICRRVRARDIRFTSGVFAANTHLLDESLQSFDSSLKVNPPLRSKSHVEEICAGLKDGTIDIISSGHRPASQEKKMLELDAAPFGMIALETAVAQVSTFLVSKGILSWRDVVEKMSTNPAELMGIPGGTLKPDSAADLIIIAPDLEWKYDAASGASRSCNSPFSNSTFRGRVVESIVGGQTKWTVG